jgi:hypothetical protein
MTMKTMSWLTESFGLRFVLVPDVRSKKSHFVTLTQGERMVATMFKYVYPSFFVHLFDGFPIEFDDHCVSGNNKGLCLSCLADVIAVVL